MSTLASHPEASPFDHRALLYADDAEYLDGTIPFLRDGLEDGDLLLVAVGADKARLLRGELAGAAAELRFVDMRRLGRNPGRIISAWCDLVGERNGRGVRGIGEPIWPGRGVDELAEAQRHERLLNVAFADTPRFDLLCPYDARLPDDVLAEALHSHPAGRPGASWDSGWNPFDGRLHPVPAGASEMWFGLDDLAGVRALVGGLAAGAGVGADRRGDLVLAVGELASNSVRHGGGAGLLRAWRDDGRVVCQVEDTGHIRDPLAGRRRPHPGDTGGYGLWLVHQLCDLVQVRSAPFGSLIRVSMNAG